MRSISVGARLLALLSLTSAACTGSSVEATRPMDAGSDVVAPSTPPAPADAALPAAPPCEPLGASARAASVALTPARDHHVAFVHEVAGKPYLYVVAGARDGFAELFAEVVRAPLADDGDVGPFEPAGTLPHKLAGMGLSVVGEHVVLSGGALPGGSFTTGTLVGRLLPDGTLGDWKVGGNLPTAVQHPSSVSLGRDIYVLGGTTGRSASPHAVRARLAEDGTLGTFDAVTSLDPPRSHQAAFAHAGRVYVAGGIDRAPAGNPPSRSDILAAEVLEGGALGAWAPVGELPVALSVHPAEALGCQVLVAGGLGGESRSSPFSDALHTLTLGPDGAIVGSETLEAKLSVKRGHVHQLPRHGRHLYVVGGRLNDGSSTGAIDVITLDRDPPRP